MNMNRMILLVAMAWASCGSCGASRTLVDEVGRTVVVPDHPHRIICLVPSVTNDVFALGAGADVVAVSDYTKYPAEAKTRPSVGSLTSPSLETIVALHPDLVIGMRSMSQGGTMAQLERLSIPVYEVDPHGLEGIFRSVADVGEALNRGAEAKTLVAQLRQRVAAVRARVQGKPVVTVFLPLWYDPVITIGRGAFMTEAIAAAGGRSVTDDIGQEWPQVSLEAVMARKPEALLLVQGGKTTLEMLKNRAGWSELAAVQRQRAYSIDDRIDLPSPIAIDALEDLSREFHP